MLQGVTSSIAQYNKKEGKIKGSNKYQKQVLNEVRDYITEQKDINNIILIGDLNQNINFNEIRQFIMI